MLKKMSLSDKKDYWGVVLIGFCVPFFLIPTVNNVIRDETKIPFLSQNLRQYFIDLSFLSWLFFALLFSFLLIAIFLLVLFTAKKLVANIPVLLQIIRFVFVGGFNTLLDWGVVNLLVFISGLSSGWQFYFFKATSFLVANIASYFWNKNWTFQSDKKNSSAFWQFFVVSLLGLLINVSTAWVIVDFIGPIREISAIIWMQFGLLTATAISMVWNFIGYKLIVFKK